MYITGADWNEVSTSAKFRPGQLGVDYDGKMYKYVQYMEATAAVDSVVGEVCYYYTLDGYKNTQVTSDLDDSIDIGAGVLLAVMSDQEWSWIQIRGAATLTIALDSGADGNSLTADTATTDGSLGAATAVTDHICAVAGDASDNEIVCLFPF